MDPHLPPREAGLLKNLRKEPVDVTKLSQLPGVLTLQDGTCLFTPALAGQRLNKSRTEIGTMVKRGELHPVEDASVITQLVGQGRRPEFLLPADEVEAARRAVLEELGALEEVDELRGELASVRRAWEDETSALRSRVAELEESYSVLLVAVDERLSAWAAQVRADQAFLEALRIRPSRSKP